MNRLSSLRATRAPMPSMLISGLSLPGCPDCPPFLSKARLAQPYSVRSSSFGRLRHLHPPGGVEHGLDDVVITGAATDIALELMAHGVLVEVPRSLGCVALHNVDRRHDHARRAIAALQAVIVAERRLHRMQLVTFGDAFDGGDMGAVDLADQNGAGFHGAAVDMHDTGAA